MTIEERIEKIEQELREIKASLADQPTEPKDGPWRPERGANYKFVGGDGYVLELLHAGDALDIKSVPIGNCFDPSTDLAERVAAKVRDKLYEWLAAICEVERYIEEHGIQTVDRWTEGGVELYYSKMSYQFYCANAVRASASPLPRFAEGQNDKLDVLIRDCDKRLREIFGVKEETQ